MTHIYKNVDTEIEVTIEIEDVLDFLSEASKKEIDQIKSLIKYDNNFDNTNDISANNLYDREKILIFKKAMNKYNIDQLLKRLDIKQHEL